MNRRAPLIALGVSGFAVFIVGLLVFLSPSLPLISLANAGVVSSGSPGLALGGNLVATVAEENFGPDAGFDSGLLATHSDRPRVSITSVTPKYAEEGCYNKRRFDKSAQALPLPPLPGLPDRNDME